ncbi:MAG: carotenoid biosynthesis protein [Candidatus Marsarchaeota archaeon]|nr:carotenoid biosynthesis protein [Candidatus Marsarchaeota archaeon]MCL5106420.1 carotenoid biosynthesis protein [Candidatus Marsarchaeota archaeon]
MAKLKLIYRLPIILGFIAIVSILINGVFFFIFMILSMTLFVFIWRPSYKLFVLSAIIGSLLEIINLKTDGFLVGLYRYNVHPLIFGAIPVQLIIWWAIIVYLSYTTVSTFFKNKIINLFLVPLLASMLELVNEPVSADLHIITWLVKGTVISWYGIPWTDFVGVYVGVFIIMALFYLLTRKEKVKPVNKIMKNYPLLYLSYTFFYFILFINSSIKSPVEYGFIIILLVVIALFFASKYSDEIKQFLISYKEDD